MVANVLFAIFFQHEFGVFLEFCLNVCDTWIMTDINVITLWGIKNTFLWLISSYRIHSTLKPLYRLRASGGLPGILPTLLLLPGRIFPQRLPYTCGFFMREMCFAHVMAFNSHVTYVFNTVGTSNIHHTVWVDVYDLVPVVDTAKRAHTENILK